MTKKPKPGPNGSRTQRKPTPSNGFRSPFRISIDQEALAALDKRAIAAQVGIRNPLAHRVAAATLGAVVIVLLARLIG